MIGRNVVSAAFERDFSNPRHKARRSPTELAPPTSTPNSVRRTVATLAGAVSDASGPGSSAVRVDATVSVLGAAGEVLAGFSGSISFAAPESGGAIDRESVVEG